MVAGNALQLMCGSYTVPSATIATTTGTIKIPVPQVKVGDIATVNIQAQHLDGVMSNIRCVAGGIDIDFQAVSSGTAIAAGTVILFTVVRPEHLYMDQL